MYYVKRLPVYIAVIILFHASDLAAQKCDNTLYITEIRNYRTLYTIITADSIGSKESLEIKKAIVKKLEKLPNNDLLKNNKAKHAEDAGYEPDRIITARIKKTTSKKEEYAGNSGKDRYLIRVIETVYYEIEIELEDTSGSSILYSYKKSFRSNELSERIDDIYSDIEPFYREGFQYCTKIKQEIKKEPLHYFSDIYIINGFPSGDYSKFLSYTAGAGGSLGIRGAGTDNAMFSAYLETAWNNTGCTDINYAITVQGGLCAGYDFTFEPLHIIPEFSTGYILSYYNTRYPDMETWYKNIILRFAVEINTVIYEKTLFIKPALTSILEEENILYSIDLLLDIKLNI